MNRQKDPNRTRLGTRDAIGLLTTSPLNILKAAISAVPSLKYVLGVLGLVAAVSIARGLVTSARIAVIGALIILVLMVAVVIFAALTQAEGATRIAAVVMMFAFLTLTIATVFLIFTSVFFKWPLDLHRWIVDEPPQVVSSRTPTATTPPDSATMSLNEGRTLRETIKDIAEIDNSRAIFLNCSGVFMDSKIRGGVVRATDVGRLLESLQYRITDPRTNETYNVTRKEREQTYEIQCIRP